MDVEHKQLVQLLPLLPLLAELGRTEHITETAELLEGSFIQKKIEPFPRGKLPLLMLRFDPLLSPSFESFCIICIEHFELCAHDTVLGVHHPAGSTYVTGAN